MQGGIFRPRHHLKKRPRAGVAFGSGTIELRLGAARAGKLSRLETFAAEHRPTLRRPERHRGFLAACRAVRRRLHSLPRDGPARRGAGRPLGLARLAPLGLVLEILVGKEELLAGRPDELGAAIHAVQRLVLELHRSLPLAKALDARRRQTRKPPDHPVTGRLHLTLFDLLDLAALLL